MKNILLFAGAILILCSCATKKVNFDQLQDRNGLYYLVNDKEPFTGEVISYVAGKVEFEGEVRNGLKEGLWIYYYPSGQKAMEGIYKDGLKEGTWSYWTENGEASPQEVYKLGNRLGNAGISEGDGETTGKTEGENDSGSSESSVGGTLGGGSGTGSGTVKEKEPEPPKPKPVNWDMLTGGPVKYYQGRPYTGPFIKWYKEGSRGKYLEGSFTNGYRSGKWTYYDRAGRVKDIRYY